MGWIGSNDNLGFDDSKPTSNGKVFNQHLNWWSFD